MSFALIHKRQELLRQGYFKVAFTQISFELFIDFILIIINVLMLIRINNQVWFPIFPTFFNFFYETILVYNICSLVYFLTYKKNERNTEMESRLVEKTSIRLIRPSFKAIHLCSIIVGIGHTIAFAIVLFFQYVKNNKNNNYDSKWYFYFFSLNNDNYNDNAKIKFFYLSYFLPNFILFILSVPYLIMSINAIKMNQGIFLKHFAIYCLFTGLISLIFPLIHLFF